MTNGDRIATGGDVNRVRRSIVLFAHSSLCGSATVAAWQSKWPHAIALFILMVGVWMAYNMIERPEGT